MRPARAVLVIGSAMACVGGSTRSDDVPAWYVKKATALQTWEAEDRPTLIVVGYMDVHLLAEHMETPVAEIQDALAELVRAGYVTRLVAFKKVVQHG